MLMVASAAMAQKPGVLDYEVRPIKITPKQGVSIFMVYSIGKNSSEILERAKRDAIHAVLFKGVPGDPLADKPLINDPAIMYEDSKYFTEFFGVKDFKKWKEDKGSRALYLLYVTYKDDVPVDPDCVTDLGGGLKKMCFPVVVNHAQLREKMEKDGYTKKFGF